MCLARPRFPVLPPLRGLLGQVFPGHPGTLTHSFSLITFDIAIIIKVGYCITPRPYQLFSSIFWLFSLLVFLLTFGKCGRIKCLHVSHVRVRSLLGAIAKRSLK